MAKKTGYRRASGAPAEGPAAGGMGWPRWMLVWAFGAMTMGVVWLVAGGLAVDVFETWGHALLVLPVVATAGMLGVAMTAKFAGAGCFAESPWPDLFRGVVSVALGLGAYALAMLFLGAVHLLNPPWAPALVQGVGVSVGIVPTRAFLRGFDWEPLRAKCGRGEWMILLAAVPVAMLLIAVTFPPGSLWGSEGRGYDVLEYHLEMPREYGATNAVGAVSHNVYSYLPANVEMLYLLMMQMGRCVMGAGATGVAGGGMDHLWGVFAAQILHAVLALLTVVGIGVAPLRLGSVGRIVAMVLTLAIPWTIVTGSLAYDEWGMMLFGTLALGLAMGRAKGMWMGLLIGLLLGLAVGCKMTAGVFFAVPVAVILIVRGGVKTVALAGVVAAIVYSPWAVRAAVGSGGNPVFPLAAKMLPRDGWTAEQADRFERGHGALAEQQSLGGRTKALVEESVLNEQWSPGWGSIYVWAGDRPPAEEFWWKHVGVLWLIVPLAVVLAFLRGVGDGGDSRGREVLMLLGVLAMQIAAWMFLTHLQSRFLLPIVASLGWLIGMGAEGDARGGLVVGTLRLLVCTVAGGLALCTAFLLLPEAGLLGGLQTVGNRKREAPPIGELFSRVVNVAAIIEKPAIGAPVPEGKILLVGNGAPLFWEGDVVYNTTFDRNLLGDALRAGGAEGAAKWLAEQRINYIVIDWSEVNRLRGTYGFDEAITPEAIEGLVKAGIKRVQAEVPASVTILQVTPVTQ